MGGKPENVNGNRHGYSGVIKAMSLQWLPWGTERMIDALSPWVSGNLLMMLKKEPHWATWPGHTQTCAQQNNVLCWTGGVAMWNQAARINELELREGWTTLDWETRLTVFLQPTAALCGPQSDLMDPVFAVGLQWNINVSVLLHLKPKLLCGENMTIWSFWSALLYLCRTSLSCWMRH